MTAVQDILAFVEALAPQYMKMDWDHVGLLCGSKKDAVTKILIALDPFEGVAEEAAAVGAQLILTHHPLIFDPLSTVTDETSIGRTVRLLCRNGISAINAHTNLDCAPGGVNDTLAKVLGLENPQVISPAGLDKAGREYGLLRKGTVPEQSLEDFLLHIKKQLNCQGLRYVMGNKAVKTVAVGGGACGGGLPEVFEAGCDTFVTADIKYNQFWDAKDLGINLIDAGHFYTENPICAVLQKKLQAAFPELTVLLSQTHRDCVKFL